MGYEDMSGVREVPLYGATSSQKRLGMTHVVKWLVDHTVLPTTHSFMHRICLCELCTSAINKLVLRSVYSVRKHPKQLLLRRFVFSSRTLSANFAMHRKWSQIWHVDLSQSRCCRWLSAGVEKSWTDSLDLGNVLMSRHSRLSGLHLHTVHGWQLLISDTCVWFNYDLDYPKPKFHINYTLNRIDVVYCSPWSRSAVC